MGVVFRARDPAGSFVAVNFSGASLSTSLLFAYKLNWQTVMFVGVGDRDGIALAGARGLNKALAAGGAKKLVYKEYANVEHMVIVRAALPDVFELFDRTAAEK